MGRAGDCCNPDEKSPPGNRPPRLHFDGFLLDLIYLYFLLDGSHAVGHLFQLPPGFHLAPHLGLRPAALADHLPLHHVLGAGRIRRREHFAYRLRLSVRRCLDLFTQGLG